MIARPDPNMKMGWPELVGKDLAEARAAVLKEDPSVYIQELGENSVATMDYRIDRVRIVYDRNNKMESVWLLHTLCETRVVNPIPMKYRTRKLIENAVDTVCIALLLLLLSYVVLSMRKVNSYNYKKLYRSVESEPLPIPVYYEGAEQLDKAKLQKDHNVFLNDLEYGGVDPLSASALLNDMSGNKGESSIEADEKGFSYEKKKLSSSAPLRVVDYFDPSFDYVNENKKYRELLSEVTKELEYKSEKSGDSAKKKGRWGSKSKKAEERASARASESVSNGIAKKAESPEFVFQGKTAAQLHEAVLAQMATAKENSAAKKVAHLTAAGEAVGRTAALSQGVQGPGNDAAHLKVYVVPLGIHLSGQYAATAALLDELLGVLTQDATRRMTWSELEFFQRWYASKEPAVRETVRSLVEREQIEFALSGLSGVATEGAMFEDVLNAVEQAARWLENEFHYRCRAFYSAPRVRITQSEASLLKEGGVEMLVVDGADPQWFEALSRTQGREFLWQTDAYRGAESRLFTHVSKALTEERARMLERVAAGDAEAVAALVAELTAEAVDGRCLVLWPLVGEAPLAKIDKVVSALNAQAADKVAAATASFTSYLTDCHAAERPWPVRAFSHVQTAFDFANGLYAGQPLLRWRHRLGARFLAVFNLLYAHCSLKGDCALPPVSPDAAFFLRDNYYPSGKPADPVFHALFRTRQLQAVAAADDFLNDPHGARSEAASALYGQYHESLLQGERQAGKMLSGMVGIAERVSPNEIDPQSIYSIYHRTVEWTKKKEIGVVIVNTFSSRGKELVRLRVASSDLCAYNMQKMKVRQQMTQIDTELYELLFLMRIPRYSYTTVILHWCEGTEKDEGIPKPVEGRVLPGDAYKLQFDENGHITHLIANFDSIQFAMEAELAVLTPSPTTPHAFVPHGLDPSDPLYINPYLKRLVPPTESLSHSALRDPIQSVLVQRYRDVGVVTTRLAKSIGVDRKTDSRGHLLEVSFLVKNYPADGVLVAYYRFKDVQNRGKIHVNPMGHSTVVREAEPLPADPAADPTYLNRNVFSAGSFSYIQDEDVDPWKSNVARVTAFFRTPRGVMTMESGSMVFPLHARGAEGGAESGAEKTAWDLDATEQELSFLVQYANDGVFSVGEKLMASMNNKPAYFFYFNNTKENKDNKKLKLANTVMKFNLPAQIDVITLERVDSVKRQFLLRLRNTAEYDDVYTMYENEVVVDMTMILNSMGLKMVEEVSLFGTAKTEEVERERFIWTGEDGQKTTGVLRPLESVKKVAFFPLQTRCFILSDSPPC